MKKIDWKNHAYIDEKGWIHCPICARKTRTMVKEITVLVNFPLYCTQCKTETMVDVKNCHIKLSSEPDVRRRADNL